MHQPSHQTIRRASLDLAAWVLFLGALTVGAPVALSQHVLVGQEVDLAGEWENGAGLVYRVTKTADGYAWRQADLIQRGTISVDGNDLAISWTDPTGATNQATGRITHVTAEGLATRLEWDNGIVLTREGGPGQEPTRVAESEAAPVPEAGGDDAADQPDEAAPSEAAAPTEVGGAEAAVEPERRVRALPGHAELRAALTEARQADNGGFDLDMWATVVDRDGIVRAVAFTGGDRGAQWPGSRVISAQKANTANAFGLPGLALATANLFSAVQPGGSLFGLQESNPVDTDVAYGGDAAKFGQADDPMVGRRIGGVNVFGGGLGLYNADGELIGAIGVSGDTSCADHNIAWRARHLLELDYVPAGVSGDAQRPDNIVFDLGPAGSAGGFGHPHCGSDAQNESAIAGALPPTRR